MVKVNVSFFETIEIHLSADITLYDKSLRPVLSQIRRRRPPYPADNRAFGALASPTF
jgi:hypothetical protein